MAEVNAAQSAAIAEELPKVGKSIAKVTMGILSFIEGLAVKVSPFVESILVKVLTGLAEKWANSVLKKNGVDLDA